MASASSAMRTRRLIALVGQLRDGTRIPLSELASRVGATNEQLATDLALLSCCGVAPYSPDSLMPVFVEDGIVEVWGPLPALRGAIRLSRGEAEALAAALACAGYTAEDPLTRRLVNAASAAFDAEGLERNIRTVGTIHDNVAFARTASAVAEHRVLEIAYQGEGADSANSRRIEPIQLFSERGVWYVSAWCEKAAGFRTFRIDRIRSAKLTAEHFDPAARGEASVSPTAFPAAGLPSARLSFAAGESFSEREWPGGRAVEEAADGSLVAEVPFAGMDWIARRVVARLGRVEVIGPNELRRAVAALAERELDRFG